MTTFERRFHARVGAVSLELPAVLAPRQSTAIDSKSGVFEGGGLFVLVDQGPFAPSLDADTGRPGLHEVPVVVGGYPARLVTFDDNDMTSYTTALEVAGPQRVMVFIRARSDVPREVPLEIAHSVQLLEE
jgi:hypothetical protein